MSYSNYSKPQIETVLNIFRNNYHPIPLEIFGENAYKTLISTLLSSRTKDETTLEASLRLFKIAPNIKKLDALTTQRVQKMIYPVGFYRTKAKNIKKLTKIVLKKHSGIIPDTQEQLCQLPGVGRKTANLVLNRAFGKPAIAVDTHVHKISNLLGWVSTKNPLKTEEELNKLIPKKYWHEVNKLFVSIGRTYNSKGKLEKFLMDEGLIHKH